MIEIKRPADPWMALGLAVHFIARREPFSRFPAGDLARTLNAQVSRRHCLFAFDTSGNPARVVGYFGWAYCSSREAEAFARSGRPPAGDTDEGEVMWMLTAAAESRQALFALIRAARAIHGERRLMGIRHKGGRRVVFDYARSRIRTRTPAVRDPV